MMMRRMRTDSDVLYVELKSNEYMNLNELRDEAYECAVAHGWHEEELSNEHWLWLIITELAEATEADRKGKHANIDRFNTGVELRMKEMEIHGDSLNYDFIDLFECCIKGSVEEELADACIRLLDLSGLRNIDLSSVSFPISNSKEHIESRKKLTFTEWCYDVSQVIARYKNCSYPLGYLIIGILQEICCMAEIMNIDILWHIEQKMMYNEDRPYKHNKSY